MISDRGIYNGTNMCHILDKGHGYIVSKSLKKSKKTEREWTQEQNGYTIVSPNFKYKSRIVTRNVKDENGKNREIKQKVVVYWSRSFYEREKLKNQSFLDFIEKLKSNPSGFRISNSQSKKLKKFLKKEFLNKETGEIVDSHKLLPIIDEDKLTEFNELMGYYQIVTSELDMDDLEIIEKYHGLTQIEDQFHEMKETLETRPVYVSTPQHIYAHLMICFMALTMMRVIQHKIKKSLPEDRSKDFSWSYGLPGYRFSNALLDWQVEQLSEEYYRMVNTDSDDLKLILNAFDISISLDLFTRGQLRSFSSFIEVF